MHGMTLNPRAGVERGRTCIAAPVFVRGQASQGPAIHEEVLLLVAAADAHLLQGPACALHHVPHDALHPAHLGIEVGHAVEQQPTDRRPLQRPQQCESAREPCTRMAYHHMIHYDCFTEVSVCGAALDAFPHSAGRDIFPDLQGFATPGSCAVQRACLASRSENGHDSRSLSSHLQARITLSPEP